MELAWKLLRVWKYLLVLPEAIFSVGMAYNLFGLGIESVTSAIVVSVIVAVAIVSVFQED
jgi:hypothetical protein